MVAHIDIEKSNVTKSFPGAHSPNIRFVPSCVAFSHTQEEEVRHGRTFGAMAGDVLGISHQDNSPQLWCTKYLWQLEREHVDHGGNFLARNPGEI